MSEGHVTPELGLKITQILISYPHNLDLELDPDQELGIWVTLLNLHQKYYNIDS